MGRRVVVLLGALSTAWAAGAVLTACGGDEPRTQSAYCDAAREHAAALTTPQLHTTADLDALVNLYALMHRKAPSAVEPEWAVMEALMRASVGVDTTKSSEVADVTTTARLAKTASDRVISYTKSICGVLIGNDPVGSTPADVPLTTDAMSENTFDFSGETVPDFDLDGTVPVDTVPVDTVLVDTGLVDTGPAAAG